jgi:hypothetical protein
MFSFAPVAHLFNSCAGLKLMRTDSDMAERVVRDVMKKSVVALPIHDSFIVPVRHQGELEEAMHRALHEGLNSLQESPIITKGYEKKVPQYADKLWWCLRCLVVPLPPAVPCADDLLPSLCVSRDGASASPPVIVAVRPSWPLSFVLLFHPNMGGLLVG